MTRHKMGRPRRMLALLIVSLATFHWLEASGASEQVGANFDKNLANTSDRMQTQVTSGERQAGDEPTSSVNSSNLVESLNERRVKESNLLAEESRQDGPAASVLAPATGRPATTSAARQTIVSGGSGNSYLAMSHDGSNRYQFGFDTAKQSPLAAATAEVPPPPAAEASTRRPGPRLMREESRLEDGTVIGRYGYTDPFNVFRVVQYVAGPDGYFASEDVGAMEADAASAGDTQRLASSKHKFQLNKQLSKALEQARALRLARSSAGGGKIARRSNEEADQLTGSGSSHHFATRINHVLGNNGVSYATAFRPPGASTSHTGGAGQWPSAEQAVYSSMRYADQSAPSPAAGQWPEASGSSHSALRSNVPAPIYSPQLTGEANGVHNDQQGASVDYSGQPHEWAGDALQSHPAWSVLNNNYNGNYHTSLIIDHTNQPAGAWRHQTQPVGAKFESNFEREAALLASIGSGQRAAAATPVATAVAAASPGRPYVPFGARPTAAGRADVTNAPSAVHEPAPYNYVFALNHFDTPLYHPEVHETPADEGAADGATQPGQPRSVQYSSTVVHSEVAAEQGYRAERVTPVQMVVASVDPFAVQPSSAPGDLQRSSSELSVVGKPGNSSAPAETKQERPALVREPRTKPPAYATRLSAPEVSVAAWSRPKPADEELSMEDSEQVSYVTNGTQRARLPDRSKKLSSIFKARNSHDQNQLEASGAVGSSTRIRRPVPVNARRQAGQQASETYSSSVSQTGSRVAPQDSTASTTARPAREFGGRHHHQAETPVEEAHGEREQALPSVKERAQLVQPAQQVGLEGRGPAPVAPNAILIGHGEGAHSSKAMIIDASSQPAGGKSSLNQDLREKIRRIQQEIAARSEQARGTRVQAGAAAPSSSTTTTTSTSTTELPKGEALAEASTSRPVETLDSTPAAAVEPSSSTQASTTSSSTTTTEPPTTTTSTTTTSTSTTTRTPTTTEKAANFLTGPLMKMDTSASSEQDEFMSSLVREMSAPFDSARATVMQMDTSGARSAERLAAKWVNETNGTTSPSLPSAIDGHSNGIEATAQELAQQNATTFVDSAVLVGAGFSEKVSATSTPRLGEPTTSMPNSTTQTLPASPSTTTTTTTTTSTTATSTTVPPSRAPRRRTTAQPRFGRLVIKRGDKVVARYNTSDSIPDSMIPVGGAANGTEIIMPDMPRLGMRRSLAKIQRKQVAGANASSSLTQAPTPTPVPASTSTSASAPTSSPTISTTTAQPTTTSTPSGPTTAPPTPNATLASGPGDWVPLNSTSAPSSAPAPSIQANSTKASLRPAGEGLEWRQTERRSLTRGARSYRANLHADTLGPEAGLDHEPMVAAESQTASEQRLRPELVVLAGRTRARRPQRATGREPVPSEANEAEGRSLAFGARNWSSRLLRDNLTRSAATSTPSNKKYDPKEDLMKLVEKIARIEFVSTAAGATANGGQRSESVGARAESSASSRGAAIEAGQNNSVIIQQTNMTTSTSTSKPSAGLLEPAPPAPLDSKPGGAQLLVNTNAPHKVSQSSSISFSVAVSPQLESQWSKLKPLNRTTASLPASVLLGAANQTKALDVRVDSHGHIHVRNNQSITVHVDIEPPRRPEEAGGGGGGGGGGQPKRRDTSASLAGQFGRDDIQRTRSQRAGGASSEPGADGGRRSAAAATPATEAASSSSKLSRRPRMLCIEVESGDSDLVRQRSGLSQRTQFTPED